MPGGRTVYVGSPILSAPTANLSSFGYYAELLTAFTGSDENPLSENDTWTRPTSGTALQRLSNQLANTAATTSESWFIGRFFAGGDAYITIATKPAVNADQVQLFARQRQFGEQGVSGVFSGYSVQMATEAGTDSWDLARYDLGVKVTLASGTREWTNGDKLGIRCYRNQISAWAFSSGAWSNLASVLDATYMDAGALGVRGRGTTFRVDDLFGGQID